MVYMQQHWTCYYFADWDSALGVNLKGYAFGIKHASEAMIKQAGKAAKDQHKGSQYAIVNLASNAAVVAIPDMLPYCTTKAGVLGMTRSCALDLGKYNIRYQQKQEKRAK